VAAGHQQVLDAARQQRAIRVVVVAAARHAVVEAGALGHVFLGHHVGAFEQAGLADAGLRRHVDQGALREARQPGAHELDHLVDGGAALHFGARQVAHLQAVEPRHVRAVAPHHAGQRRLEPPGFPGATEHVLDLAVECLPGHGLFAFEALGFVGVDRAEAEHGGHDVAAADVRRTGRCGHVEVAGGVDHHLAQDGFAPALGFADHALDLAVFHQRAREPRMQPQLDAGLLHHLERGALPRIGVEGGGKADGVRLFLAVKVVGAPALPAPHRVGQRAPVLLARVLGQAQRRHALDHFQADAAHRNLLLVAVPHVVEHQHHAARGQAAQVVVALQQRHAGAIARGGQGRGLPRGAATDHHHVRFGCHAHVVRGLLHPVANTAHRTLLLICWDVCLKCARWITGRLPVASG
jgi:hypothetical protein